VSRGLEVKRLSSVWQLTVLILCSVLTLAGCGLSGSAGEAKIPSKRESVTPPPVGLAEPVDGRRKPSGTAHEQRSPQQIAALHRVDQGKALIVAGNYTRAISHLEKTLALDSTNPYTYFYLARAHYGLSNFRESLDFLEVAESLFGDERSSLIEVWVLKGDNLRRLGQLPQARQSYERALAIAEGRGQRSEIRSRISEIGGRRSEVGDRRSKPSDF